MLGHCSNYNITQSRGHLSLNRTPLWVNQNQKRNVYIQNRIEHEPSVNFNVMYKYCILKYKEETKIEIQRHNHFEYCFKHLYFTFLFFRE